MGMSLPHDGPHAWSPWHRYGAATDGGEKWGRYCMVAGCHAHETQTETQLELAL